MIRNRLNQFGTLASAAAVAALLAAAGATPVLAQDKPQKVVLRFAADFPPPPHPAGLAMAYFRDRLPQVIPGSEARLYYRSEERRVGKECRSRWAPDDEKKKMRI